MFSCLKDISLVEGGYGRETVQRGASRDGGDGAKGGYSLSTRNGNPFQLNCDPDRWPRSIKRIFKVSLYRM
jgi:hypothetical protein